MKEYLIILVGAVLVNNYVLAKFLGICPFLGVSKKLDSAFGMSVAVIFVMALATAVTWPIYTYILVPKGLSYLQTIVFILIIAALVQFVEIALKKYIPALHKALGIYLPLITTNCAVLGVTILNLDEGYTFGQSLVNAVGSGLGFLLAMVLFSGVRSRVDAAAGSTPRFVISGEISSIYKQGGKTRKVHNVLLLPSLEAAEKLARRLEGKEPINFPRETAMGAMALYISDQSVVNFQPMNVNFGLIPPLGYRVKGKRNKNAELSKRALEALGELELS